MSFILDALRKSELERQRQNGPMIAELPVSREDRRLPWAMLAIGLLLAMNVGVLLFFLLRDTTPPVTTAAVPTPAAAAAVAPAVAPPPTATRLPPPADENGGAEPASTNDGAIAAQAMADTASLPPPAPDPTLLPVTPAPAGNVTRLPAADLPPSIDELPAPATAGLPELTIDLHIYAEDPAKRAVFINGRRYQQGAVLAEGPTVEEITREGAILRHRGQRFLLPRL